MPVIYGQQPPRQTGWDQAGFAAGTATDLLIKALLAGQLGMPTPSQNRPTGAQGPLTQGGQYYPQPQTAKPVRIGPFEVQGNLDRQLKQQQIAQSQAQAGYYNQAAGLMGNQGQTTPNQSGGVSDALKQYLAKRALAGDAEADAALQQLGY